MELEDTSSMIKSSYDVTSPKMGIFFIFLQLQILDINSPMLMILSGKNSYFLLIHRHF